MAKRNKNQDAHDIIDQSDDAGDFVSDIVDVESDKTLQGLKKYEVKRDGTCIDGNFYNSGDVVWLKPEIAAYLRECDVRLTELEIE